MTQQMVRDCYFVLEHINTPESRFIKQMNDRYEKRWKVTEDQIEQITDCYNRYKDKIITYLKKVSKQSYEYVAVNEGCHHMLAYALRPNYWSLLTVNTMEGEEDEGKQWADQLSINYIPYGETEPYTEII